MKKILLFPIIFSTMFLLSSCLPVRNNRIVPMDYKDVFWVSTDGVLEFVEKSSGNDGTVGTFKDGDNVYQINIWWSSSIDYGIYINDDTTQYLSGDCIQLEEYKFKMTVEEDRIFGNR